MLCQHPSTHYFLLKRYIQYKDDLKRNYAIEQGYHYLAIPYWTEKDQSYKQLIDNKIHEILSTIQNK